MPTYCAKTTHPKGRPWVARVKVKGKSFNLGYYATDDEALFMEQDFRLLILGKKLNA